MKVIIAYLSVFFRKNSNKKMLSDIYSDEEEPQQPRRHYRFQKLVDHRQLSAAEFQES